jgi:hypothetical protein
MAAMQLRCLRLFILTLAFAVIIAQALARPDSESQTAKAPDPPQVASAGLWWIEETTPLDNLKRPSECGRKQTGASVSESLSNAFCHRITISNRLTRSFKIYELHRVYLI